MQFINEFKDIDTSKLLEYLSTSKQQFKVSELYNGVRDEKFVDESLRKSKFRAIVDPELFEISNNILKQLTEKDELNSYSLVRNDITHIIYEQGGFFKAHRDYLSLTSNIIEEYTLLICITPDITDIPTDLCVGGETRIHVNPHYIHTSKATTKPGCGLLFRKDLLHEGLVLESGNKEIVSMNIWVTRKQTADDAIVFITFPEIENVTKCDPIKEMAYGASYVLSVNDVMKYPKSALAAFCQFSLRSDNSKILKYKCEDVTYEQFYIVFKVMCGMYITIDEFKKNIELLDFFGLGPENVLIDFINEIISDNNLPQLENHEDEDNITNEIFLGLGNQCCYNCYKPKNEENSLFNCTKCKQVAYCSRKCQIMDWNESHKYECLKSLVKNEVDKDFIICPTEDRTTVLAELAKELKRPYVKFQIVFAEGVATFGGEMSDCSPIHLKMTPVWSSFGDYDNIYVQSFLMTKQVSEGPFHYKHISEIVGDSENFYNKALLKTNTLVNLVDENGDEDDESDDEDYENDDEEIKKIGCDDYEDNFKFDLQIAKVEKQNINSLIYNVLGEQGEQSHIIPIKGIILPNVGKTIQQHKYFHVDQTNKTCFNAQEAIDMSKYIESTKFIDRVKNQLNNINFRLPQLTETNEVNFCNENVYGNFNFILVTGIISPDLLKKK